MPLVPLPPQKIISVYFMKFWRGEHEGVKCGGRYRRYRRKMRFYDENRLGRRDFLSIEEFYIEIIK